MKFSDIKKDQWPDLQPYLDTCLLPLTGLSGGEEPWQVMQALERLGDMMEPVEIPFKGRVVTYPSLHYYGQPGTFVSADFSNARTMQQLDAPLIALKDYLKEIQ